VLGRPPVDTDDYLAFAIPMSPPTQRFPRIYPGL
jgi:hypothetical protein